jgi:hypothetical protein
MTRVINSLVRMLDLAMSVTHSWPWPVLRSGFAALGGSLLAGSCPHPALHEDRKKLLNTRPRARRELRFDLRRDYCRVQAFPEPRAQRSHDRLDSFGHGSGRDRHAHAMLSSKLRFPDPVASDDAAGSDEHAHRPANGPEHHHTREPASEAGIA